jgi:hypothetical protein
LIQHLTHFAQQRYEDAEGPHHPLGYAGEQNLPPERAPRRFAS